MIPRDPDSAAARPEPDASGAEWATEESLVEPATAQGSPVLDAPGSAADSRAAIPEHPSAEASGPLAPSPAPEQSPIANVAGGAWLASAQGLVPGIPVAQAAPSPAGLASDPASDLDFSGTRVYPRPQQPADDWGWRPADDGRPAAPVIPSVAARTAASTPWAPVDAAPGVPSGSPSASVDAPGAPTFGQQPGYGQPSPYGQQPGYGQSPDYSQPPSYGVQPAGYGEPPAYNPQDPYGRELVYGRDTAAPAGPSGRSAPVIDPRYDPAYQFAAASAAERQSRRGVPWRRLLLSFVLGLILAGVAAGGAIYAYEQQYANRILPNIHIGSVDVSGLTRDVAYQRVADAYKGYGQGTVQVTLAGATTLIPYSDFDRRADVDAMLDAAFAIGREAAPVPRLLGELRAVTKGVTLGQPAVLMDAVKLQARIHAIAQAAEWPAVDATAVVTPTGFATTPSKTGQSVDEGTAAADAANTLATTAGPDTVQLTLTATAIPPAVSDASAQAATTQAALMQNDVTLTDGPDSWVIPAATVHTWLSFTVINNRARIVVDTKAVLAELKPLAKKIDRTAVNASVKLVGTKIVFDKPSVDGRTFNPSKTTTAVVNALRNRALGTLSTTDPIPPVLALVAPTLTTDQAKAAIPLMKQISSWTTNYQPSDHNGFGVNIRIPTSTINGYVVAPGDTFSFWKAVGPVTKELGYQPGGAIIDGHTEPQGAIGGGICSCSTTLFNAVLRAGYAMGDRLNHYYYITRYPLGLDATVFISAGGQAQDMTWTNDTSYPVVIEGINGKAFVKFVLYSVPNDRTTTFTTPIVKNYTTAHTETHVDKTIPRGTTKQIEYATDGEDVTVTRTVTDKTGAVIHKDTYFSHYATVTGIILTNP